jgi:hypothetical protein
MAHPETRNTTDISAIPNDWDLNAYENSGEYDKLTTVVHDKCQYKSNERL